MGDFARALANGDINKKSDGKTIGLLVVPPQGLDRRALARWSGDTFEN